LLCAKEPRLRQPSNEEGPEGVLATDSPAQPIEHARYLRRTHEVPDIDIVRLAQHLAEQLVQSRAIVLSSCARVPISS
jgi:hypothetical protein